MLATIEWLKGLRYGATGVIPEKTPREIVSDALPTQATHNRPMTISLVVRSPTLESTCVICERCARDVVPSRARRCAKRVGVACFLFFLVKGLLWLLVPLLWALSARR